MLLPKRVKYRRVQRGRMTGKAMRRASHKLPVRCKFVKREELDTVKEGDAE